MAAVELDPLFVKALKLLQSKAKDSSAQLKAMLDDAIAQRKGLKVPSQSGELEKSKNKSDADVKRKEGEKRSHDKSTKDPFEPDVKRSKFEQLKQQKEKEAKEKEREKIRKEKERKEREEAQRQKDKAEKERKEKELAAAKQEPEILSDEEETAQQMDAGDFAIDLGIACVVCRQFDVSSGNQLVECQECHSLYHQECHKPTVTEQDVSDPRFVWYCSRCTKSFKKMMAQKPIKPSKPVPLTSTSKEPTSTIIKTSKSESDSASQAFRRMDPKAIVPPKDTGNLTSSSKAMVGLAGLAANLTKPRGDSKSSSSSKKSSEHKGDSSKSSSKSEMKSTGSKPDSSLKPSSTLTKSDSSRKTESSKSSSSSKEESREGKKSESKSSSSSSSSGSSKSDSSSRKEDKKDKSESTGKSSKEEKKSDKSSPKHSSSSSSSSPPTTPVSPDSLSAKSGGGSSSGSSGGSSNNKQAVANLSMVTANKRIQMMKKKAQAQTKPQEKRVHIK